MIITRILAVTAALVMLAAPFGRAQDSDYEVQKRFEGRARVLRDKIDSSNSTQDLDALRTQLDALAIDFQPNKDFLDKALYPTTFEGTLTDLREVLRVAYNRTSTIQSQGIRINELESSVASLTGRLDTLSAERQKLFTDLAAANKNLAGLRETVKRLTANLDANNKLMYSLLDSLFLPYNNIRTASDVDKENLAGQIQQASVLNRVYATANDNLRFVETTQLQPKDYTGLVDHYRLFQTRWQGLNEKMRAVVSASQPPSAAAKKGGQAKTEQLASAAYLRGAQVDSVLQAWNARLMNGVWSGVSKEFTDKGITVNAFHDGPSFTAAVQSLLSHYNSEGGDKSVFLDQVWKGRIEGEWKDVLTRDGVLGKAEFASLEQQVNEFGQSKFDGKFLFLILAVVVIAIGGWLFLLSRKKKATPPASTTITN